MNRWSFDGMTESNPPTQTPAPAPTQSQRRIRFGFNVFIAIAAAVAITIMINWLVYSQIDRVSPAWRGVIRYDLTSTRQHSLSDQTVNVLKDLDRDYQIVTLLRSTRSDDSTMLNQARDLIDEYARRTSRIKVEHINPTLDVARLDVFYGTLNSRYESQLTPIKASIDKAREVIARLKQQTASLAPPLRALSQDPSLTDKELQQFLVQFSRVSSRLDADTGLLEDNIQGELARGPLPVYSAARESYKRFLIEFDTKFYGQAIELLEPTTRKISTPATVREGLLHIIEGLKTARTDIAEALKAIEDAPAVESYDKLSVQLSSRDNSVVLLGDQGVRVISLGEMFRPALQKDSNSAEPAFLGEEKITAAIIAMGIKEMPLVIFVHNSPKSPTAPSGGYSEAARRLTNLDFRVEEWSPAGRTSPMGQSMPPSPPPEPKPGQKAVWVLLPLEPPNPQNPMSQTADQAIKVIVDRIAKGDSVMVFTTLSPAARFGPADPIIQFLEPWCLQPSLDRIILRQVQIETKETAAVNIIRLEEWPTALPISQAVRGMNGVIYAASPLELLPTAGKDVKTYPLIEVRAPDMWAERNISKFPNVKLDPAASAPAFTIGAAAETKDNRLILITDPTWASDVIITNADPSLQQQGIGLAEFYGAAYPANAELFINGVYWLGGLDHLIAAGARSQDIRRITGVSKDGRTYLMLSLILGMPAIIAASGIGVWMIRRRG